MHAMVLKAARDLWHGPSFPTGNRGPGEIRVESRPAAFAGPICMWSTASYQTREMPIIPGHEIVGRIDAIGAGV